MSLGQNPIVDTENSEAEGDSEMAEPNLSGELPVSQTFGSPTLIDTGCTRNKARIKTTECLGGDTGIIDYNTDTQSGILRCAYTLLLSFIEDLDNRGF